MIKYLIILFTFFQLFANNISGLNIIESKKDTISVDIVNKELNYRPYGYLRNVILLNDKFYCIFESWKENTSRPFKKMVELDKNGDFVEDIFVPQEIQQMSYLDLIVENDSLFLKNSQFKKETYVLKNTVKELKLIQDREFSLFEDSLYSIFGISYGEWGGTVYFQDKNNRKVYETFSLNPIVVNKINNEYYVSNLLQHMMDHSTIIKIDDPKKLKNSQFNFQKKKGSDFKEGTEILLDTSLVRLITSFVVDQKLYNMYSIENETFIGIISNEKIKPIFKFPFAFDSFFTQRINDNKQILVFYLIDLERQGILEIDKNRFIFNTFKVK